MEGAAVVPATLWLETMARAALHCFQTPPPALVLRDVSFEATLAPEDEVVSELRLVNTTPDILNSKRTKRVLCS